MTLDTVSGVIAYPDVFMHTAGPYRSVNAGIHRRGRSVGPRAGRVGPAPLFTPSSHLLHNPLHTVSAAAPSPRGNGGGVGTGEWRSHEQHDTCGGLGDRRCGRARGADSGAARVCRGPTGHPETVATGSASGAGNPSEGAQQPGTGARSSTLTVSQSSALAAQAEQEKLAGDLYQAFADKYPEVVFDRIAAAEDQHLAAVRQQLTVYGVDDPTAGQAPGEFATAAVQARYDQLLAQGMTGQGAALRQCS